MPPKETDEPTDMDADSSTAPVDDAEVSAVEAEAPAESSAATDATEADTLSVVRDVVEAREEQQAEAASSAEGEEGGEGADESATAEPDNEEYSDVEFNKHPRFRQLLAERNTFKQDAGRYRNVETFLGQTGLTSNEAADAMTFAGLAKTDPAKAWEQFKPWVQQLLVAAGEVLPDDLAQRVQKSEITQDVALELSRIRAREKARDVRQTTEQQRGQDQQVAEQGRMLMGTAEQWLTNRRIKDPNFGAKEARLGEKVAFLQRTEGRPNTADGVKAQLKKAYDAVNREIGTRPAPTAQAAVPAARKPALRPITGGQVAGNAANAPAPKTSMDVVRAELAKRSA